MTDTLKEHDGKVSIGGRNMTNLRFADALAQEEVVVDKNYTMYRKKLNAEKTKLIINNT